MSRLVQEANWHGADAQSFERDWHSRHRPALHRASTVTEEMSVELQQQANEQRQASGDAGGGSVGLVGGAIGAAGASGSVTYDLTDPAARAQAERVASAFIVDRGVVPLALEPIVNGTAHGSGAHVGPVRTGTVDSTDYGGHISAGLVGRLGGEVRVNTTNIKYD